MSADKRSVHTDALATLGTVIDDTQKRDAIHIAVEPVVAGENLAPGEHITVKDGVATSTEDGQGLGIVDPFLTKKVRKGERFWFLMYPRMVTSLRHVWAHPAFSDEVGTTAHAAPAVTSKETAEKWIRACAEGCNVSFGVMLDAAENWIEHEDYHTGGHELEGVVVPDEFWPHYEVFTGKTVPMAKRGSFFSCSC